MTGKSDGGSISIDASASAPIVYFESAPYFGFMGQTVGQITLTCQRLMGTGDQNVITDHVVVAHLRANIPALASLRAAIDGILLMATPAAEGSKPS